MVKTHIITNHVSENNLALKGPLVPKTFMLNASKKVSGSWFCHTVTAYWNT